MTFFLRPILATTCGIFLLVGVCFAQPADKAAERPQAAPDAGDRDADHAALRALGPIYEQAANEGKPELLKPYLDPEFTGVMVTEDDIDSFASLEDYWAKMQKFLGAGGKYHVKVNVARRSILSGDLAVAYGTTDDQVLTGGGKEYRFEGRWTAVCRKRDGQWKILRVHGSMAPISNPFVAAAVQTASITAGAVAGIGGLLVGWIAHLLLSRRRPAAART